MAPKRTIIDQACVICGRAYRPHGTEQRRRCCSTACRSALLKRETPARFWSHVDTSGDCWIWTAARFERGYGAFSIKGHNVRAHRYAYEITYGPPGNLEVCHRCDNPSCVRPDHLFLGTNADNMRDMYAKGRGHQNYLRGERGNGARLSEAQVQEIRTRYAAGGVTYRCLAGEYEVSRNAIWNILTRRTWIHI